ncbi:hypothetical protein FCH28_14870 [Streptomyces piniterrae]|uniref:Uncharacterized protein n=1 Tax=Streptomyces piniterrae TaxID=2571125 RepID=A0A4U0NJY8_9ACTN|nr:hypothetical protein [Streptomyces piniterrae]TJZ54413.1 hypothetical protein FCH28_14870 [Streptomyces piniterrae]
MQRIHRVLAALGASVLLTVGSIVLAAPAQALANISVNGNLNGNLDKGHFDANLDGNLNF